MARSFTVLQLRTKVRQRADMEVSRLVSDSEINDYLSAAYTELYEIQAHSGQSYFESNQTITTSGTDTYALPADFYGMIGIDYKLDAQRWTALIELMMQERNTFMITGARALAYRKVGANVVLYPTPPTGQTYRIVYVPAPVDIATLGDAGTIDGISGWEELFVILAVIQCIRKEESDTTPYERERDRLMERIMMSVEDRELATAQHIVDVESYDERTLRAADPADWRFWK